MVVFISLQHYASRSGHYEVCEALLMGGAKVDLQTRGSYAFDVDTETWHAEKIII